MAKYEVPGPVTEEIEGSPPVVGLSISTGILMGVTRWGPVNDPLNSLVRSFPEFVRKFGTYDPARADMAYCVKGFFEMGGTKLYVNRLAHYVDITDPLSIIAAKASTGMAVVTSAGAASAAVLTTGVGPFNLLHGYAFQLGVDAQGPITATLTANHAERTGGVDLDFAPYTPVGPGNESLVLSVDGGPEQAVAFVALTAYDAEAAADLINQSTTGVRAYANGLDQLVIGSATAGNSSSITIGAISTGALLVGIGHAAGTTTEGASDCANVSVVTAAELDAWLTGDMAAFAPDPAFVAGADGTLTITSPTTGVASTLEVGAASTAGFLTALGLTVGIVTGAALATEHTLTVEAKHEGVYGNGLSVIITDNPVFPSAGVGNDLSVQATLGQAELELLHGEGLQPGVVLELADGVNTEYGEVLSVARAVVGFSVVYTVTLTADLAFTFAAGSTVVQSLEFDLDVWLSGGTSAIEEWSQLSMLDTVDNYLEAVINDEDAGSDYIAAIDEDAVLGMGADKPAAGTYLLSGATDESVGMTDTDVIGSEVSALGLRALDALKDAAVLGIPGYSSVAVIQSAIEYAELRQYFFYVVGATSDLDRDALLALRSSQGGFDSRRAAMYAPRYRVLDPVGVGKNPRRYIDPAGHVLGLYSRVDSLPPPDGGPWCAPAGTGSFGKLVGVLGLEREFPDADVAALNTAGVNVTRTMPGFGVVVWGARTLALNVDWRYISVVRNFIFCEKSIVAGTTADTFRNNDYRLWDRLKGKIDAFLRDVWRKGGLRGRTEAEAFFSKVGYDLVGQAEIDEGVVIGEVGLAAQKPGEFLVFRFSQLKNGGGSSLTEL